MTVYGDMTDKVFSHTFVLASTFTTGDDKLQYTLPCDAMIMGPVQASLITAGTSGGSTIISVENSTDSQNMLSGSGISFTTGSYTAEANLSSTQAYLTASDGDIIVINVDSVSTGGAEKDLSVTIQLKGR